MNHNQQEVSRQNVCETSFLRYVGLFAFTAAFIAAVALCFSLGYEDAIAAVTHAQRSFILLHHKAEHYLPQLYCALYLWYPLGSHIYHSGPGRK